MRIQPRHAAWTATVLAVGALYGGGYLFLRSSHYFIHRYTSGSGSEIVRGEHNAMIHFLSPDPEGSLRRERQTTRIALLVFWPLRRLEAAYHHVFTASALLRTDTLRQIVAGPTGPGPGTPEPRLG